jgi:hypothetical protein
MKTSSCFDEVVGHNSQQGPRVGFAIRHVTTDTLHGPRENLLMYKRSGLTIISRSHKKTFFMLGIHRPGTCFARGEELY